MSKKRLQLNDITIIIPTLNEVEAIGKVLDEVLGVGISKDRIIVVDGGSTDGTREVAKSRDVNVILQEGKGKAKALKTALRYVSTPYLLVMDGDYSYPARYIVDLYEKILDGYDLVIGARIYEEGSQKLIFKLGNSLLTRIFNLLFGTELTDVLSGMYAIKVDKLKEVGFEMKGFSVESEIVAHVASTGGSICEIPIKYRKRLGKKKLRIIHGLLIAKDMIKLAWRYNPTFFIFSISSLLLILGLLLGGWVAYQYFSTGIKYYMKGLIASMLTLLGLQSLLLAILALYMKRMEWRINRKIENILKEIREYSLTRITGNETK